MQSVETARWRRNMISSKFSAIYRPSRNLLRFAKPSYYTSRRVSLSNGVLAGEEASLENRRLRIELAAAYREFDRLKMNEGIDNHLSLMAPAADGSGREVMLIFPYGLHWSEVTASSLVGLDKNGDAVEGAGKPHYSSGPIHFTVHSLIPEFKCLMHLHPTYTTSLACLKDPSIKLLHGNMGVLYNYIVYDNNYAGFADCEEEGKRLAAIFGPRKRIMIMGNHGTLIGAHDVATAFHDMYYLEKCCQFQVIAMSTGKELNVLKHSDFGQEDGDDFMEEHRTPELVLPLFESVKRRLLRDCPDFMD